jgi:phytoene dehydrogenase-like protein
MKTFSDTTVYDAIIVGAGLGGLSSALHLQKAGLRVALLEQQQRVGGLCGTHWHQGREYVIACNDFGTAMPKWLRNVGVDLPFSKYSTRICYGKRYFSLPPDLPSILQLLPHAADLWRYIRGQQAAQRDNYERYQTLADLVDHSVRNAMVADLLKIPGYLMGVSPNQLRLDALKHEFEFGYGYTQPTTPQAGPQALADAMADKIRAKGNIMLDTRFIGVVTADDGLKQIQTSRGEMLCRYLVSAVANESDYPENFARGLPLSMFWLAVDKSFNYPSGIHTCIHYPPNISDWFGSLEQGILPADFGFHVFKSQLGSASDCYTMNLYFYLPHGEASPKTETLKQAEQYLFSNLERMLPGISAAIRERHFVSPDQFTAIHGMSSRVLPVITPAGYPKPDNYHVASDTYRAGASYYPPGDHASAAMLSGRLVAEKILSASPS